MANKIPRNSKYTSNATQRALLECIGSPSGHANVTAKNVAAAASVVSSNGIGTVTLLMISG